MTSHKRKPRPRLHARTGAPKIVERAADVTEYSETPAPRQVSRLARRFGLILPTAALVASLAFGEGRA